MAADCLGELVGSVLLRTQSHVEQIEFSLLSVNHARPTDENQMA